MEKEMNLSEETMDELAGRYLLFYIEDTLYGVSLSLVLEIINIQSITRLPGIAPYIKGIVNLRGKVVPVMDVRLKLGLCERAYDDKTCIVVLNIHDMQVGLIVDSVSEVVSVDPANIAAPPQVGALGNHYLASVSQLEDKVVLNLNCDTFFEDDIGIIL